jgi:hypothetical protein
LTPFPGSATWYAAYHAVGGSYAAWAGALEVAFFTLLFWLAYFYVPDFQVFVHSIGVVMRAPFRSGGTLRTS